MRHRSVTRRGSPVPTLDAYVAFVRGLPRTVGGGRRSFSFAGETYPYLYSRYNLTWMNERAVEVPIVQRAIAGHDPARVLEIGNVLSHYGTSGHVVIDKYEPGPGVRNIDVLDLEPDRRWDLIVSVSTLEHVGVDDAPRDPTRGALAAQLLADRLAPGGRLLVTVPVGYNPVLDRALVDHALPGLELRAIRRTRLGPHWVETDPASVVDAGYDWRNSNARAVLVGVMDADGDRPARVRGESVRTGLEAPALNGDRADPGIPLITSLRAGWRNLLTRRGPMTSDAVPGAVCILDDGLIMGGGQRFGLRLAEAFADRGLSTRFLTPRESEFGREATRRGFEVVDVTYPRLVPPALTRMPAAIRRLRAELESVRPNTLVIGNTARCQAYATAALLTMRRWPVFVHLMHEQTSIRRPTARAVYRRIGALVAVGDQTADLYRERLPGVSVQTISNFMDATEVRRIVGIRTPPPGGSRPILGFLGRLIGPKGILELVEELAGIPDAWEELRIAAPPQDRAYTERVRARIAELGLEDRIRLLGEVRDLDAFFASIDVLIVPSVGVHEGQPTVILEGLLYGRPVIVRQQLRSPHLEGLPIGFYATPAELADGIRTPPAGKISADEFLRRFGATEVVDTLLRVATDQLGGGEARARSAHAVDPVGPRHDVDRS